MESSMFELVNVGTGERITVIQNLWARLVAEANSTANVRGLDEELQAKPGTGYNQQGIRALLEVIRVRRKYAAKLPTGTDELQKAWEKWAPFMDGAKELRLEGHSYLDFHRHQQPAERKVKLFNRQGAVEMGFPEWQAFLEKCLAVGWVPRGSSSGEVGSWPQLWGGWYTLPGPKGNPTAINATEATELGRLLTGALMKAVLADPGMIRCGADLDQLLRLRAMLNHDGVQITFS